MTRRLLALALSIPLAAAGATSVVLHVCQAMGDGCECEQESHAESDAHGDHGHGHAHGHAAASLSRLEPQPCCSVEVSERATTLATYKTLSIEVEQRVSTFIALAPTRVPSSRIECPLDLLRERAPPAERGPPLFIRHCSLLN